MNRKEKTALQLKIDYRRRQNLSKKEFYSFLREGFLYGNTTKILFTKYKQSEEYNVEKEIRKNIIDEDGDFVLDEKGNIKTEVINKVIVKRKKKIGQPIEYPKNRKFKKSKLKKRIN